METKNIITLKKFMPVKSFIRFPQQSTVFKIFKSRLSEQLFIKVVDKVLTRLWVLSDIIKSKRLFKANVDKACFKILI